MSNQLRAVLLIAEHPAISHVMLPLIAIAREDIDWRSLNYGVLSGGQKAAVSWLYSIWTDGPVPKGWRDPFEGFGVMDRKLQLLVLQALATRHETLKPPSALEQRLIRQAVEMQTENL